MRGKHWYLKFFSFKENCFDIQFIVIFIIWKCPSYGPSRHWPFVVHLKIGCSTFPAKWNGRMQAEESVRRDCRAGKSIKCFCLRRLHGIRKKFDFGMGNVILGIPKKNPLHSSPMRNGMWKAVTGIIRNESEFSPKLINQDMKSKSIKDERLQF